MKLLNIQKQGKLQKLTASWLGKENIKRQQCTDHSQVEQLSKVVLHCLKLESLTQVLIICQAQETWNIGS